jgi:hypothetical protein
MDSTRAMATNSATATRWQQKVQWQHNGSRRYNGDGCAMAMDGVTATATATAVMDGAMATVTEGTMTT